MTETTPTAVRPKLEKRNIKKYVKRGVGLVSVIVVSSLVLTQCFGPKAAPPPAELTTVSRADIPVLSSANGSVQAAQTVPLAFRAAGTIESVDAVPGKLVKAGDVLAVVNARVAELDVEAKQAGVDEAVARATGTRVGTTNPKEKAAGAAGVAQSKAAVAASRTAAQEAERVAKANAELNERTVRQAEETAATDRQQLTIEEARLQETITKRTDAIAKRDAAAASLSSAKAVTAEATGRRDGARDAVTKQRQRVTELQAVQQDAQRAYNTAIADDDRNRQAAQAAADPTVVFVWAKSTTITRAELAVATAEKATAAADAALVPLAAELERQADHLVKAETEQSLAQGRFETAVSLVDAAQSNVDAQNRTREQASIAAGKADQNIELTRKTNKVNAARDKQTQDAARQATAQAEAAVKSTQTANAAKNAPVRPSDVSAADATVRAAQVALDSANDRLNDFRIIAPFGGVVSAVTIKQGEQAQIGVAAVTIMTTTGMLIRVGFPEVDAALIEAGDTAEITFDALPDAKTTGRVEMVEPSATVVSGVSTYFARVMVDSIPATVRVGMSSTVRVLTDTRRDVLTVPLSALGQSADGSPVVRKVTFAADANQDSKKSGEANKTEKEPARTVTETVVETGVSGDGIVEILKGVSEGEQVEIIPVVTK
jgi:HlyD family secretion protein